MMKGTWIGPDGYVPGLGMVKQDWPLSIVDDAWARALEKEGKWRRDASEDTPRAAKPAKRGGE